MRDLKVFERQGALKKIILLLALAVAVGCTSAPRQSAAKRQPKPPDLLTGRVAFQKLLIAAHGWAPDVQPFRLQSQIMTDADGRDGKADLWIANFASESRSASKPFIWSGTSLPDAPLRGISPGTQDGYNPGNTSTQVFNLAYVKVDSDAAFAVAQKHGGEKLLAEDPKTPVFYVLDWYRPTRDVIWHVIYGNSQDDAKLHVVVNAGSGDFMRVQK